MVRGTPQELERVLLITKNGGERSRGGGHEQKSDRAPPRETAQEGADTRKRAGSQSEVGQEEELAQVKLKLASAKAGYEASRRPKNVTRTRNPSGAN